MKRRTDCDTPADRDSSSPTVTRRHRLALPLLSMGLYLSAGCSPVLTADDTVVRRNGSILMRAYVERKVTRFLRSDVEEQPVQFYVNGELAAETQTDRDGVAVVRKP